MGFRDEIHRLLREDARLPGKRVRELLEEQGYAGSKTILDGSSFDGRGARRYVGASPQRSARRIVLRPWPVRRTISSIDKRFTKYKRRISAHCSS